MWLNTSSFICTVTDHTDMRMNEADCVHQELSIAIPMAVHLYNHVGTMSTTFCQPNMTLVSRGGIILYATKGERHWPPYVVFNYKTDACFRDFKLFKKYILV